MFGMPDDTWCRQFADYVGHNFVTAESQRVISRRHCGRVRLI